ncbi:MAG TPA: excinuclease ABC subunit A, partial [Pirellulales bacterium]
AFDEIREVYAETPEAKVRNYGISHFSFNSEQGRCGECEGAGVLAFDMQFLPDVYVKCPACRGTRYRREILDVTYRDRSIARALDLTASEGFVFFRGRAKLQAKLKALVDVGLGYLKLGQPANTLSGGEAQRLKLALRLTATRSRTLLILDEPSGGLHPHDVQRLLECFDALLSVGATLIVVDHHPQLLAAADWVLDLGPGSGPDGGRLLAQGRPEDVAQSDSPTASYLAAALARQA